MVPLLTDCLSSAGTRKRCTSTTLPGLDGLSAAKVRRRRNSATTSWAGKVVPGRPSQPQLGKESDRARQPGPPPGIDLRSSALVTQAKLAGEQSSRPGSMPGSSITCEPAASLKHAVGRSHSTSDVLLTLEECRFTFAALATPESVSYKIEKQGAHHQKVPNWFN